MGVPDYVSMGPGRNVGTALRADGVTVLIQPGPTTLFGFSYASPTKGGKDSGIFGGVQLSQSPHHPRPPGGKSSHIFRDSVSSSIAPIHPNKPKDTNIFAGKSTEEKGETNISYFIQIGKQKQQEAATQPSVDEHEPRLGPRPLAHNKVIQPPGGKSSIVFY
ncbi:jupiter microtubule associated homolog 2-like [Polyodon spathula]|uniref:jupiter microtubule associated homolog 2-like n=1 Tax=Polyodon spathula TaxID=7913 RepID=UPI001B7F36B4|nr:jupiter microtubule associated homolog 2-like [Polyodon spathula]